MLGRCREQRCLGHGRALHRRHWSLRQHQHRLVDHRRGLQRRPLPGLRQPVIRSRRYSNARKLAAWAAASEAGGVVACVACAPCSRSDLSSAHGAPRRMSNHHLMSRVETRIPCCSSASSLHRQRKTPGPRKQMKGIGRAQRRTIADDRLRPGQQCALALERGLVR